ncbi:CLP protease proteolytic subunit 6 [Striga asiatica]|uniref:CLP protease proteolytic subunit 6 n=1 Tax=Striga asiatica TaxID=4170 RepID=A0A5A7R5F1_STRAF|nr:CLP protease proteolytic subunit 6 [Striga asiatica]
MTIKSRSNSDLSPSPPFSQTQSPDTLSQPQNPQSPNKNSKPAPNQKDSLARFPSTSSRPFFQPVRVGVSCNSSTQSSKLRNRPPTGCPLSFPQPLPTNQPGPIDQPCTNSASSRETGLNGPASKKTPISLPPQGPNGCSPLTRSRTPKEDLGRPDLEYVSIREHRTETLDSKPDFTAQQCSIGQLALAELAGPTLTAFKAEERLVSSNPIFSSNIRQNRSIASSVRPDFRKDVMSELQHSTVFLRMLLNTPTEQSRSPHLPYMSIKAD